MKKTIMIMLLIVLYIHNPVRADEYSIYLVKGDIICEYSYSITGNVIDDSSTVIIDMSRNKPKTSSEKGIIVKGKKDYPRIKIGVKQLENEQVDILEKKFINHSLLLLNPNSIYGSNRMDVTEIYVDVGKRTIPVELACFNFLFIKDYLIIMGENKLLKITKDNTGTITLKENLFKSDNGPSLHYPYMNVHTDLRYETQFINSNLSYDMLYRYYADGERLYLQTATGRIYMVDTANLALYELYSARTGERHINKGVLFYNTIFDKEAGKVHFLKKGVIKTTAKLPPDMVFPFINRGLLGMICGDRIVFKNIKGRELTFYLKYSVKDIKSIYDIKPAFYFTDYYSIYVNATNVKKDNPVYYIINSRNLEYKEMDIILEQREGNIQFVGGNKRGIYYTKSESSTFHSLFFYDFHKGYSKEVWHNQEEDNIDYFVSDGKLYKIITDRGSIIKLYRLYKRGFVQIYERGRK